MKAGVKTSEFWVSVVVSVLGVLVALGIITPDQQNTLTQSIHQIVGAVMTVVPIAGYALSRGRAKGGTKSDG